VSNPFGLGVKDVVEAEIKEAMKSEAVTMEKLDRKIRFERNGLLPRAGGEWADEPGNSDWTPNSDAEPGDRNGTNPEHKTWGQIKEEYGFESIPFHDGEPDFSEISKGEVEIDDFTDDRDSNFAQADEKLAEQRGCTPEEVAKWREEHKYTWHECKDCKTMQKVPSEVHGNISHSGGVSEYKSQQKSA
jgi:hypothetical protein